MRRFAALSRARYRLPILALCALWSAGCFKYARVETNAVPPEEDVRIRVTRDAAIRVGPHLGNISERLEGRLAPLGQDSLVVAVWIGKDYIGSPFENTRQRVSLTPNEIVEVRRRTISWPRTALAAAGLIAGTVLFIDQIGLIGDDNPRDPRTPYQPPVDMRGFPVRFTIPAF